MNQALTGRVIAIAEGRQLEELATMLEKEAGTVLRCPLVNMLDTPDQAPVHAWLDELITGRFAYVVFLTGEGVRRLLDFAERGGRRCEVVAALGRTRLVTRGPKPVRALKEVGLTPYKVAEAPTTEGVIAALRTEPLSGQTVGVQFYAAPNEPLEQFLAEAGAKMVAVIPYVYAPAADAERVADLIARTARGEVDVVVFTSSPQVDRLYEVAVERHVESDLAAGLAKARVAAVGPVVAENLRRRGVAVPICPEQGFVMKNLVKHIKDAFGRP